MESEAKRVLYRNLYHDFLQPHSERYKELLQDKLAVWKSDDEKNNFKHAYAYLLCSEYLNDENYINEVEKIRKNKQKSTYNLDDTVLSFIPTTIQVMSNLTVLYLSEIAITRLPSEIKELSQIQSLIVSKCNLTLLPYWVGKFKKLKHLQLDRCKLSDLPESLSECTSLSYLNVEYNSPGMKTIDSKILKLPIEVLHLNGNPITWDQRWKNILQDCHTLCIDQTEIQYLSENVTKNLRYLSWSSCKLMTIDFCKFTQKLYHLNLCHNYLQNVDVLRNLSLHYLNLEGNPVENVQGLNALIFMFENQ